MDINRTDLGTLLHSHSDLQLKSLINETADWLDATDNQGRPLYSEAVRSTVGPMLRPGGGWIDAYEVVNMLVRDEGFGHLAPVIPDLHESAVRFLDRFRVQPGMELAERDTWIREHMIGNEMRLAVDGRGNICDFDDCPPDGWRGVIDYAEVDDDTLVIIDFKNRPAMFTEAELRVDEQVSGVYMHIARIHFPQLRRLRAGIHYFEFGVTQLVDLEPVQVEANFDRARSRARHKESLGADKIVPEPGWGKCQYCNYLQSCDAGAMIVEPGIAVPSDMDSAKRLAEWYLVTGEKIDSARKALKAFTAEYGPVFLDDKTGVGHAIKDRVEWDKDMALRVLKSRGRKLSDFTSLDLGAVKRELKDPDTAEAMKAAQRQYQKTEFEVFRANKYVGVKVKKAGGAAAAASGRRVSGRVKSKARDGVDGGS